MANVVEIIIKATNQTKSALNTPIKDMDTLMSSVMKLGPAFTLLGTAAGTALVKLTSDAIKTADEMVHLSEKTGISIENLYKLKYAAEYCDVPFETLTIAFKKLSVQMFDSNSGSEKAQKNFKMLGINIKDATGSLLPTEVVLGEIAEKFKNMADGPNKAALAIKLFGRSGESIIPVLNLGKDGIKKMSDEAVEFGRVLDSNTARQLDQFNDDIENIMKSGQGVGNALATGAAPGLMFFAAGLKEATKQGGELNIIFKNIGGFAINLVNLLGAVVDSIVTMFATAYNMFTQYFFNSEKTYMKQTKEALKIGVDELKKTWDEWVTSTISNPVIPGKTGKGSTDKQVADEQDKLRREQEEKEKAEKNREAERDKRERERKKREALKEKDDKIGAVSMMNKSILDIMDATNSKAKGAHKAFSVTLATIDAYRAITRALADLPFPFNIIQSAAIGGMAFANVRAIQGVAHGGLDEVPTTGTYLLNKGEQVLTPEQKEANQTGGIISVNLNVEGRSLAKILVDLKRRGLWQE